MPGGGVGYSSGGGGRGKCSSCKVRRKSTATTTVGKALDARDVITGARGSARAWMVDALPSTTTCETTTA